MAQTIGVHVYSMCFGFRVSFVAGFCVEKMCHAYIDQTVHDHRDVHCIRCRYLAVKMMICEPSELRVCHAYLRWSILCIRAHDLCSLV